MGSTKNVRPKFMLRRAKLANICAIILRESRTNMVNRILEATGTPERCHYEEIKR